MSLNKKNKGNFGSCVEKYIFKIYPGNKQVPDFEDVGIELKCVPIKFVKNSNGISYMIPKERVSLSMINYHDIINETNFYLSTLYKKCNNILFIFYEYMPGMEFWKYKIIGYYFYNSESDSNIQQIERDYHYILDMITQAKAEYLSEGSTKYLGAVTKGKNSSDLTTQPFSEILVKKRCFSFKKNYISLLLQNLNKTSVNSLISYIMNNISGYQGKTLSDLCEEFNINKIDKSIKSKIVCKMLKIKNYYELIDKFNINKLYIKNIELKPNGSIKEKIGLIDVDFEEFTLISDPHESELINFLSGLSLILFIWEQKDNKLIFSGVKERTIQEKVVNDAAFVWEHTRQLFLNSECIKKQEAGKIYYNFCKISDNKSIHIRPHDIKRVKRYQMPNGEWLCKFQYWLNDIKI